MVVTITTTKHGYMGKEIDMFTIECQGRAKSFNAAGCSIEEITEEKVAAVFAYMDWHNATFTFSTFADTYRAAATSE